MCMDDIKLFTKNEKELESQIQTVRIYSQDIGMEFGIEKCAMLITKSRKRKNDGRNSTTKSRKNQNTQKKGNVHILGNIESRHHWTIGDKKKKILKRYLRWTRKLLKIKLYRRKIHQRDKHQGCLPCHLLGTILEMDKGKTSTNGPEDKKAKSNTQDLTSETWVQSQVESYQRL